MKRRVGVRRKSPFDHPGTKRENVPEKRKLGKSRQTASRPILESISQEKQDGRQAETIEHHISREFSAKGRKKGKKT